MRVRTLHSWRVGARTAVGLQRALSGRLRFPRGRRRARWIAGADLSFSPGSDRVFAGVVVLSWPALETIEERGREARAAFPYVPGLLSFREIPALLPLFRGVTHAPDLVVCDGQGTAHPRRFGLACHLGLLLGVPTIGCAKSILVGTHGPLGAARGSRAPLLVDEKVRGFALRTRAGVRPLIVSPGHLISAAEAIRWSLLLSPRFRVPEPIRRAHELVNRLRREAGA